MTEAISRRREELGIHGKATTPVPPGLDGRSSPEATAWLPTSSLVYNNARLAAQTAAAYCRL
ncbi:MAG: hypothetical protein ACLU9S_23865 [Oscillospiraceae bacterium]